MSWCRVGIEFQRAFQLRILALQIPVENSFRFAEIAMRLGIFLIEGNRLQRGGSCCRISFEGLYIDVRQEIPNFRDPSPSTGKCGVFLQRALKETESGPQILLAAL